MANFKYFADLNGGAVELENLRELPNAKFAELFPGVKGKRFDSYGMLVGYAVSDKTCIASGLRRMLPVTRTVEYKRFPSKHECDARCINATGRVMKCECACGGKNHGRGAFNCTAEAA